MKLALEIITPTKVVLSEEIDEITLNTSNGEISILPGHVNLFTKVLPGEATIKRGGKTEVFALTGGFLELSNNHLSLLADYAVRASDIEIAKAEQAKERAKQVMKNKEDKREFIEAEAELRKALLELKVARKHKSIKNS